MSRDNPYIGPRAFRVTEKLPNREREAKELTNLVMAERVVLLHATSGAGKTSLIQTSVTQRLTDEGLKPTRALRVECPRPPGVDFRNRYVYSLTLDLLGSEGLRPEDLAKMRLSEALAKANDMRGYRVLIIDQLEEILTLDPADLDTKTDFFRQLGEAIEACSMWALLAVRDDYLGSLDHYLRLLPGRPRVTYRLDLLGRQEALAAIRNPASERAVEFTDDAANMLVDKLAGGGCVEPVQLQVVCRRVWRDWDHSQPVIGVRSVENVDIDTALGKYYSRSLDDLVEELEVDERVVRDWFEQSLITDTGYRTQTLRGPEVGELEREVLQQLERMYLIRSDLRAGSRWYELAHDRLVGAVLENNRAWQLHHLASWQVAAYEWNRKDRDPSFLLPKNKLAYVPLTSKALLEHELDFLRKSYEDAGEKWRAKFTATAFRVVFPLALVELVVIVVLVVLR